jgi:hypothetical protein
VIPTVRPDPSAKADWEPCCFCGLMTLRWTAVARWKPSEQVACCADCGDTHNTIDVPTKEEWFARHKAVKP